MKSIKISEKLFFYHNYGDRIALCVLESFKQPLFTWREQERSRNGNGKDSFVRKKCRSYGIQHMGFTGILRRKSFGIPQYDVKMVHDFEHQKFQTMKADKKEIIDYTKEDIEVYSRGISPVYIPDGEGLRTALLDRWLKYEGAKTYGKQQIKGMTDFISYGYLENPDYLLSIKEEDTEDVGGMTCRKYKVRVRNTLRQEKSGEESDFEFRKAISANGLDVLELKASYPQVYRLLKESFNKDAEEFFVWVDNNDVMVQIERDYTFQYYVNVMKEHSEKIEDSSGNMIIRKSSAISGIAIHRNVRPSRCRKHLRRCKAEKKVRPMKFIFYTRYTGHTAAKLGRDNFIYEK